jgi:hypothetical protein
MSAPARFNLRKTLRAMPDAYLECRSDRHSLALLGMYQREAEQSYVFWRYICTVCDTKKVRVTKVDGTLIDNDYDWPDDYRLPGSGGVVKPQKVRGERIRRMIISGDMQIVSDDEEMD